MQSMSVLSFFPYAEDDYDCDTPLSFFFLSAFIFAATKKVLSKCRSAREYDIFD